MKVFSMFSGIGGFDLAMRNLGHEIIGACEIDKYARKVYARQFPGVPIHNDATRLQAESLPQFDVLCAGFPCQAFSIAGKRRGFEDTRGSLFFEIARIAKEKKPSILLLENVKGLLSHDKGETFRTIISTLDEMGYDAEWQVLNSKYHVPQNRERIFIVGHSRGQRARQVFPLGDFNQKTDRKIKKAGQLTSHNGTSFYDISGISPTLISSEGSGSIVKIKHHINSTSQADRVYDTDGIGPTLGIGNAMSKPLIGVINDKGTFKEVDKSTCIDANYHKGMDNHGQRTMIAWSSSGRKGYREERIKIGEANTLTTGDGCKNQSTATYVNEGMKIRKLTPKECERLQGFPDDWTKYDDDGNIVSDTQRYKMCGNAVTVPVVQYIASHFEFPS
jgi:DNA (cytosine-5)-methyltransferase 1